MSWLAMVNDWGLGQLSSLVDMQDLNLRATGGGRKRLGFLGLFGKGVLEHMTKASIAMTTHTQRTGVGGNYSVGITKLS
jgi:hypothetical protein